MSESLPPNHRLLKAFAAVDAARRTAEQNTQKQILQLTDAVRLRVLMRLYEGYSIEPSDIEEDNDSLDMYLAASRDKVFALFVELINKLEGDVVIPTLMRTTKGKNGRWEHLTRDPIDKSVLIGVFQRYEDCILHNGLSSLIISNEQQNEVAGILQSRTIIVTADTERMGLFESVAQTFGLPQEDILDMVQTHNPRYITTIRRKRATEQLREELSLEIDENQPYFEPEEDTDDETDW